jgi:hypothetical protein
VSSSPSDAASGEYEIFPPTIGKHGDKMQNKKWTYIGYTKKVASGEE